MDLNGDGIHDAIWIAIESDLHDWVDANDTISVIVDFDHQPTSEDQEMLEREVDFRTQFRYHLIDSIAGRVAVEDIVELSELPGVVLIELDGILTIQMNEVNDVHGIPMIWEDTGYTGKGSVVSIIRSPGTAPPRLNSIWQPQNITVTQVRRTTSRSSTPLHVAD